MYTTLLTSTRYPFILFAAKRKYSATQNTSHTRTDKINAHQALPVYLHATFGPRTVLNPRSA